MFGGGPGETSLLAALPSSAPARTRSRASWRTAIPVPSAAAPAAHARGAYGGFWTPAVWRTYGHALRAPIGALHWSGTECSTAWNAKMEGAIRSGEAVVLAALG